ncbi:MAG: TetR/AcrR family transcriptional regulator [bacterium]|nr:TetR/AcrR family transcriptional regulator [bacterium]
MPSTHLPRRTQKQRRETTRRELLEATVEMLVEHGWAGATTTRICARSGLSQGALFSHFPTKAALVAAAAAVLFADLKQLFQARLPRLVGAQDRAEAAVRVLWEIFQEPKLHTAFELYNASRTDRELARTLAPVADQHGADLRRIAHELFPNVAGRPDFETTVSLVVNALQGAALGSLAARDFEIHEPMLAALAELVRKEVA